jgi:adenosylcobinamide-GDP ribazoletransferase
MADTPSEPQAAATPAWPGWLIATAICVRFYSRLPLPAMPGERDIHSLPDFRLMPRALPLAALVIALPAGLVLLGAALAGVGSMLAGALAVAVLVFTTGVFHEDGLADSADGLFGGHTPERRLEIMKDSRIGSYGGSAMVLTLLLRASALASILDAAGAWAVVAALLAAAPWSRFEGLRLLASQEQARTAGTAASVGQATPATVAIAGGLAAAIATALTLAAHLPLAGLVLGLALAHLASRWLARTAQRLIGGQTGDILGAAQQLSEFAIYLGFALALGLGWK